MSTIFRACQLAAEQRGLGLLCHIANKLEKIIARQKTDACNISLMPSTHQHDVCVPEPLLDCKLICCIICVTFTATHVYVYSIIYYILGLIYK